MIATLDMAQLLVRKIPDALVRKLKHRAALHGISAEAEHRRILEECLSRPDSRKPSLLEFLLSDEATVLPDVELNLDREQGHESHRDILL